MPTTYSTLQNISDRFKLAADASTGLGSYRMEDISEVNQTHNTTYPLLLIEPSTSTVENINRSWEKHKFIAYLIEPDNFNDEQEDVSHYDSTQRIFSTFLDNVMTTRTGVFGGVSVNKKGMIIERVKNIGNDKLIGIKSTFEIDMPSVLSQAGSYTSSLPTTNLSVHFKSNSGITVGSSSLSWVAVNDSTKQVEKSTLSNDSDAFTIPTFSNISNSWIYEGHSPHQSMVYPSFASGFSSDDFSIFMLVNLHDDNDALTRTLFSGKKVTNIDGSTDDWFRLLYTTSGYASTGGYKGHIGLIVDTEGVDGSSVNYQPNMFKSDGDTPDIKFGEWMAIGFINDKTNQESRVVIGNADSFKINNYVDDYTDELTNEDLYIGAFASTSFAVSASYASMNGELKDVLIYEGAVNDKTAKYVNEYLMRRVAE